MIRLLTILGVVISIIITNVKAAEYYCIQHSGGRYITMNKKGNLILTKECKNLFTHLPSGAFQRYKSSVCITASDRKDNSLFNMRRNCGSRNKFEMTLAFSLYFSRWKKCIHPLGGKEFPEEGTALILHSGCDRKRLQFKLVRKYYCLQHAGGLYVTVSTNGKGATLTPSCVSYFLKPLSGLIRLANSNQCLEPMGSADKYSLKMRKECGVFAKFKKASKHGIINVKTGRCIHPYGGSSKPSPNTKVVVGRACNEPRLDFKFVDVNVALGKPTSQSTKCCGGLAKKAVDGNKDTNFKHGSCTSTTNMKNPWWRVDLGQSQLVCTVVITNRQDCCADRLDNFEVWVGDSRAATGRTKNRLCGSFGSVAGKGKTITVRCKTPLTGRYVIIRLKGKNTLTLCEVEVYSACSTNDAPVGYNSAYHKCKDGHWQNQYGKTGTPRMTCPLRYCIRHHSGLYVTACADSTAARLTSYCITTFTVQSNNALKLVGSRRCLEPKRMKDNARFFIKRGCDSDAEMIFTKKNSLQHVKTKKCIHPLGGKADENVRLILHSGCDEDRLQFKLQIANLAYGKPTSQSSTDTGGDSSHAVDGVRTSDFKEGSCTATKMMNNSWWRVDLGQPESVCLIKVTNRDDASWDRLKNFDVYVGNNGTGNGVTGNNLCARIDQVDKGETFAIFCPKTILGRYVFIRLKTKDALSLCEVEVYGSCVQ